MPHSAAKKKNKNKKQQPKKKKETSEVRKLCLASTGKISSADAHWPSLYAHFRKGMLRSDSSEPRGIGSPVKDWGAVA